MQTSSIEVVAVYAGGWNLAAALALSRMSMVAPSLITEQWLNEICGGGGGKASFVGRGHQRVGTWVVGRMRVVHLSPVVKWWLQLVHRRIVATGAMHGGVY